MFLHVEASDEAGHEGDFELKKKTIEDLDSRICRPIVDAMKDLDELLTIAILPDHPTPCAIRTHSASPVPFLIYRPGETPDDVTEYNEVAAVNGSYGTMSDDEFIKELLKK